MHEVIASTEPMILHEQGAPDLVKGTFAPDEAFSFEHLMNAVSLATLIYGAVKAAEVLIEERKTKPEIPAEEGIPWDSWENYEKTTMNGQIYAKVGDRLYSKHAVDRMQPSGNRFGANIVQAGGDYGRSIAPQYVEDIIRSVNAVFQPKTGNYVYASGSVKVILNQEGAVVTILTYQ